MAGDRGALGAASQSPRVQVCRESVRSLDHLGVAVALPTVNQQLPIGNRCGDGLRDGRHGELSRCVAHGSVYARSRSSVVVMVASSDRVLAMMDSPYSVG